MDRDCANITQIGGQKRADLRNHRRDPVFSIVVWHRQSGVQRFSSDFSGACQGRRSPFAAERRGLRGFVPSTSNPAEISTYIDKDYERIAKGAKTQIDRSATHKEATLLAMLA